MDTIKFEKQKTKIIAHRGLSGIECENTAASMVAAGNRSYFGMETDVRITKDGSFVLFHDETTARISDENLSIANSTEEELRQIILYDLDKKKRADLRIPTLAEYVRICKKYEKICVIELKNDYSEDEVFNLMKVIENEDYQRKVIIISFSYQNLVYLRNKYKTLPAQFLVNRIENNLIERLKKYNLGVDVYYPSLNESTVNLLKNANIKINCWTCDDPLSAEKLASWGVDYITSNILE